MMMKATEAAVMDPQVADPPSPTFGDHTTEVLAVLGTEIGSPEALLAIANRANLIIERSVDPIAGPPEHPSDGLLYGLIQSGKTSIITVAAAMAVDRGFQCLIVLTSDIDLLYDQTRERVIKALRGLTILGKNDWKDPDRFERVLRTGPFVVVCSKNAKMLGNMLEAFKAAGAKGLSAMIIDDEADQASLNTLTSKGGNQTSRINEVITEIRDFFRTNTYLQVTATPQALFLQRPDHRYRPSFTVLSEPGLVMSAARNSSVPRACCCGTWISMRWIPYAPRTSQPLLGRFREGSGARSTRFLSAPRQD